MLRAAIGSAAVLFSAACGPLTNLPVSSDQRRDFLRVSVGSEPTPHQQRVCAERGGHYGRAGMTQYWLCITPYSDADVPCSDDEDCQGGCRVYDDRTPVQVGEPVVGQCAANNDSSGCYGFVVAGRYRGGICED